jgi:DNA-binding NtrC family response regulator
MTRDHPACDVLVVDDEAVVRRAVERVLADEGIRVAAVSDAASALAHPAAATCRLVLCDLMLPDLPGGELLERLRALRPDRPVVVITGYATPESLARAAQAGAAFVLNKPFDATELVVAVRRALAPTIASGGGGRP